MMIAAAIAKIPTTTATASLPVIAERTPQMINGTSIRMSTKTESINSAPNRDPQPASTPGFHCVAGAAPAH